MFASAKFLYYLFSLCLTAVSYQTTMNCTLGLYWYQYDIGIRADIYNIGIGMYLY